MSHRHYARRLHSDAIRGPRFAPRYTAPQIGLAYNKPANLNGTGKTVAYIELGGGFAQSDVTAYCQSIGVPVVTVGFVSVDGATNSPDGANGAQGEVMLDLCVGIGIAPKATHVIYMAPNSDQGFVDAIVKATQDGVDAISISWGSAEDAWSSSAISSMNTAMQAAGAAGITVTAASGDNGSADGETGDHVDFPASSPYCCGCGGTTLNASATGQILSEVVWPDTGGGVSSLFALPSWQANAGVPGGKFRGVPDVAGDADPNVGWAVIIGGQSEVFGGTSAVAPLWANIALLLNQALGKRVGFLPALLYPLAEGPFHDIIQGNNGTYTARQGYDCCTGLGSPDIGALVSALSGTTPIPPNPPNPPTPPTPPTPPVPPTPSPTLQQKVDAIFAYLEKQYARQPWVVYVLKIAQQYVDKFLSQHPSGLAAQPAAISPTVIEIVKAAFAAAEAAYPEYALFLTIVQGLVIIELQKM